MTDQEPSQESIEHFELAIEVIRKAIEEDRLDNNVKRDAASEIALAIKKANAPFPKAHAMLAMILYELGDSNGAQIHADIALHENPNNFRAQSVKCNIAFDKVTVSKVNSDLLGSLISITRGGMTQQSFINEIDRLVAIFQNICKTCDDVGLYLNCAETLIRLGDNLKSYPTINGLPNLYTAVARAATPNLQQTGREQEIADVRRKAEGRSLLR